MAAHYISQGSTQINVGALYARHGGGLSYQLKAVNHATGMCKLVSTLCGDVVYMSKARLTLWVKA